jgi:hypothetical protein
MIRVALLCCCCCCCCCCIAVVAMLLCCYVAMLLCCFIALVVVVERILYKSEYSPEYSRLYTISKYDRSQRDGETKTKQAQQDRHKHKKTTLRRKRDDGRSIRCLDLMTMMIQGVHQVAKENKRNGKKTLHQVLLFACRGIGTTLPYRYDTHIRVFALCTGTVALLCECQSHAQHGQFQSRENQT